ncbi:MAG: GlsB/YeaQ/YmgE family stress response membrane protein [Erysipelotrichaceae bacterium]|nr:GlsB/YeaQ/YmgE family stress response membrane protein [Erysipelotrichaceae bacterium]
MSLIIALLFAACVGYVAGQFMSLSSPWYINILLGIAGGVVGRLIFSVLGFSVSSIIGDIIASVIGACVVIFAYKQLKK